MEIIRDLRELNTDGSIITLGKFDGIHKGHQKLLEVMRIEKENLDQIVFTFDIKPDSPLYNPQTKLIYDEGKKEAIFEYFCIDYYVLFPFDKETAAMPAEEFLSEILIKKLKVKKIVVGDNFSFGYKGLGNCELLLSLEEKYGYKTYVINRETYDGKPISSTRIREALAKSENFEASEMLGRSL